MKVKTKELRELSSDELVTRRRDLKHEMLNLRVQQQSGQLENPARIFLVRREIARLETILSERRLQVPGADVETAAPEEVEEKAPAKKKTAAKKTAAKKTATKKAPAKKTAAKTAAKEETTDTE